MNTIDYLISVALILLVVRQMRPRRLTVVGLMWPLPLIAWAAVDYVKVPELSGNNGLMFAGCTIAGVLFGVGCGVATQGAVNRVGTIVLATRCGRALGIRYFRRAWRRRMDLHLLYKPRTAPRNLGDSAHLNGVV